MTKSKKTVYAFIFARGDSKGLPGKNIRPLAGKPLIEHTIMLAKNCNFIDKIIVSTDNQKIAEIAKNAGAEVPFTRPAHLSTDTSSEHEAWQHAVNYFDKQFDTFISLPATTPLRAEEDVSKALAKYNEGSTDIIIGVTESVRNPYFNMVKFDADKHVQLVCPPEEGRRYTRRQTTPTVYNITPTAYVTSPEYISRTTHYFDGQVGAVIIPRERSVDIDTIMDFEYAEFLLSRRAQP
jgi:N-acylneuraminate cytidylyltransferase